MVLKVVYDDDSQTLVNKIENIISDYPLIKLESYHEGLFKERKKAFKIKGGFSARHTPFAVLYNDEKVPVIVLYSESNDCTFENIVEKLKEFIPYER